MDNNNPQQPVTNIAPTPATPVASPVQPAEEKKGGNKMVIWFVVGLIVIIALVGGIYFFLSKQQTTPQPEIVTQTPAPSPSDNLENDLNSINVDTSTESGDFAPVDKDLEQL